MPNQSQYWALTNLSGVSQNNGGAELFVVAGDTELPCGQFSMTYGVNSIPTATALIALGRDARTGKDSAVYQVAEQLKQMQKIRVELRGQMGDWSPRGGANGGKQQWPNGTHIIFVGYVSGISYRRSLGRVSLVLNMKNTLVDLSMSCGGTAEIVPGAPHDLMLPTLIRGSGGEVVGTSSSKFVRRLPEDMNTDISKGFLNCLMYVAENSQIQTHDGAGSDSPWCNGQPSGITRRENTRAARVIRGSGDWKGIANYIDAKWTEPYPLDIHDAGREHASKRVGEIIAGSLAGSSMWSMLNGRLLPEFGLGIVPIADQAFIVPIMPMGREFYKKIKTHDYADFNLRTLSERPLYGVGVMGSFQTAILARPDSNNKQCVGATYVAKANGEEPANDGMWKFVHAPDWMDDWSNFDPHASNDRACVEAMLGQESHDATGVDKISCERNPDEEVTDWNDVMKKYAQMIYIANALRGRQGTLVGKLRFDISPGSIVLIESSGELKSEGVDTLATDLYGYVARVTVTINSEQAAASTSFELTNLRTKAENKDTGAGGDGGRWAMDKHPFYGAAYFKGAPLVPSLEIPNAVNGQLS